MKAGYLARCFFWLGASSLMFAAFTGPAFAGGVDTSKLPPPASDQIDFTRDIKPILENSCFRCHGPEKPRSHFRLDNPDAALKGGDDGVDIIPGNSAKSRLIQYVAGLDEDMQMPPPGKGAPLTTNQIALLRAWIDQGVAWEAKGPEPTSGASFSPTVGYTAVSGNERKFREHYWQKEGANGGLGEFDLWEKTGPDSQFSASGHLLRNDYKLVLENRKDDVGSIRYGWEDYRKYYSDTGGYDPLISANTPTLNRDLQLDLGRAWVDFTLALPEWPVMTLGYEYQYKHGNEANLEWGNADVNGRATLPSSNFIRENTHIIKFDLDHEIVGTRITDEFRGEFYTLRTSRTNIYYDDVSGPTVLGPTNAYNESEGYHHFQAANTVRLERQFNDWLFASGGYLYSRLNGSASGTVNTTDVLGIFPDNNYQGQQITLQRESHVANLTALLGPWDGLTLSGGVQTEWTREQGSGNAVLTQTMAGLPPAQFPAQTLSDYDTSLVEENVALRYTKIPFTALFAEARLRQERIGQSEEQVGDLSQIRDPEFLLNTEYGNQAYDMRAGFNTSPLSWASLSAHYRRYEDDSRYNNTADQQPIGFPGIGYPGFIESRDLLTDEVAASLTLRPVRWFRTTLAYRFLTTAYHSKTDPASFGPFFVISPGGELLDGRSDTHVYSFSTTFTPWQRLNLSTTFSYQDSKTSTADNASPAVVPYRGNIYSVLANATYVLTRDTDLLASYSFSRSDFSQDNFAAGLPLGIKYQQHAVQAALTHRLGRNVATKLQYSFYHYEEPTSGGVNNYDAHAIFATLSLRLP
jgi:hypothetical protein